MLDSLVRIPTDTAANGRSSIRQPLGSDRSLVPAFLGQLARLALFALLHRRRGPGQLVREFLTQLDAGVVHLVANGNGGFVCLDSGLGSGVADGGDFGCVLGRGEDGLAGRVLEVAAD